MKNIIVFIEKDNLDAFGAAWVFYYYYYLQNDKNIKYSLKFIFVDSLNQKDAINEFQEYSEKIGCYLVYSFGIQYSDENTLKSIFPNIQIKTNINAIAISAWETLYPNKSVPNLLKYISTDMDMLNKKSIKEGIKAMLFVGDFNMWTTFINDEEKYLRRCDKLGSKLLERIEQRCAELTDQGKVLTIDEYNVYILNSSEHLLELGSYVNKLKDSDGSYLVDYTMVWYYRMIDEKFVVYMISRDIDIKEVVEKYDVNVVGDNKCIKFECDNIFGLIGKKCI